MPCWKWPPSARPGGGRALVVPTDVSDFQAVENLARQAVDHFGSIDVWVNNAVLVAIGRLEEVPPEANRRIVEATPLGYLHGGAGAGPGRAGRGGGPPRRPPGA